MPHRLLLVNSFPKWGGGAEVALLDIARGLQSSEFECLLLTSELTTDEASLAAEFEAHGIETVTMPAAYFRSADGFREFYLEGPRALRSLLQKRRIDLAHLNCERSIRSVLPPARTLGIPTLVHVHGALESRFRPRVMRRLTQADAIVVNSRATERACAARGVESERMRLVYNGMDPHPYRAARAHRAQTRAALGLAEHEIAVAVFGTLIERKGQHHLLHVAADERLRALPVRFLVVGSEFDPARPAERALRALAEELGVSDRVTFLGYRRDVPALMGAIDIMAAPFRDEPFGLVVAEAMHAGLPTVAYRSGALPELLREFRDALLVEPGNVDGLAAAIEYLAVNGPLRERMGRQAMERGQVFTVDRYIGEIRDAYLGLLQGRMRRWRHGQVAAL